MSTAVLCLSKKIFIWAIRESPLHYGGSRASALQSSFVGQEATAFRN